MRCRSAPFFAAIFLSPPGSTIAHFARPWQFHTLAFAPLNLLDWPHWPISRARRLSGGLVRTPWRGGGHEIGVPFFYKHGILARGSQIMQKRAKYRHLNKFLAHLSPETVYEAGLYPQPGHTTPRSYDAFARSLESSIIGVPLYKLRERKRHFQPFRISAPKRRKNPSLKGY